MQNKELYRSNKFLSKDYAEIKLFPFYQDKLLPLIIFKNTDYKNICDDYNANKSVIQLKLTENEPIVERNFDF